MAIVSVVSCCVSVDMKLDGLNVVVSMEYLMTLKDFFLDSLPPSPPAKSAPAPRPS